MTKRPVQQTPQPANLTAEQIRSGISRLQRRIETLESFDPNSIDERWSSEVKTLQVSIEETLQRVFGAGTIEFMRYRDAATLDRGPVIINRRASPNEVKRYLEEGKKHSLSLLNQAVRSLEEELEHLPLGSNIAEGKTEDIRVGGRKVFVVHGRDDGTKHEVARFLHNIDLEPIILHERPNRGRTIITKFQEEAKDVSFAIVLMTPDDEGGLTGGPFSPRARQNVVFELGFFYGTLGSGHVVALVKGDVETPSDFDGVLYIQIDSTGGWKVQLARELKAAGLKFDAAAVFDS